MKLRDSSQIRFVIRIIEKSNRNLFEFEKKEKAPSNINSDGDAGEEARWLNRACMQIKLMDK